MSALNCLRKKGTSFSLGEDELHAERVRNYTCPYDKICREYKENDVVENVWVKLK